MACTTLIQNKEFCPVVLPVDAKSHGLEWSQILYFGCFYIFWQRWMHFYNELFKIFPNKLRYKRISLLSGMRYLADSWWVQPFLIRPAYISFWAALHSFAGNPGNVWIKLGPNSTESAMWLSSCQAQGKDSGRIHSLQNVPINIMGVRRSLQPSGLH